MALRMNNLRSISPGGDIPFRKFSRDRGKACDIPAGRYEIQNDQGYLHLNSEFRLASQFVPVTWTVNRYDGFYTFSVRIKGHQYYLTQDLGLIRRSELGRNVLALGQFALYNCAQDEQGYFKTKIMEIHREKFIRSSAMGKPIHYGWTRMYWTLGPVAIAQALPPPSLPPFDNAAVPLVHAVPYSSDGDDTTVLGRV